MAGKDELKRWWDGLSEAERAEAIKSGDAGRLSDATQKSLKKAGLTKGDAITGDVTEFLKMRH